MFPIRFRLLAYFCLVVWARSAYAQLGKLEQCLPIPSYGSELEDYRAELRGDYQQPVPPPDRIVSVTFEGSPKLAANLRQQLIRKLESLRFDEEGSGLSDEIKERIRQFWQDHGYFEAAVDVRMQKLRSIKGRGRFGVIANIEAAELYTLRQITFHTTSNNPPITNTTALRNVFPLRDGETFSACGVRVGLDRLTRAYGNLGYIQFTGVPETNVDEGTKQIALSINLDEGAMYRIGEIKILGVEPKSIHRLLNETSLVVGKPYSNAGLEMFWKRTQKILPGQAFPEISWDKINHTVVIHLDLRTCSSFTKPTATVVAKR